MTNVTTNKVEITVRKTDKINGVWTWEIKTDDKEIKSKFAYLDGCGDLDALNRVLAKCGFEYSARKRIYRR